MARTLSTVRRGRMHGVRRGHRRAEGGDHLTAGHLPDMTHLETTTADHTTAAPGNARGVYAAIDRILPTDQLTVQLWHHRSGVEGVMWNGSQDEVDFIASTGQAVETAVMEEVFGVDGCCDHCGVERRLIGTRTADGKNSSVLIFKQTY